MHETNRAADWIGKVNGTTIGNVDAVAEAAPIRNQSITVRETVVFAHHRIDDADLFSMDLLRGDKRHRIEAVLASDFSMNAIEPRQRFRFIVRHLDPGH